MHPTAGGSWIHLSRESLSPALGRHQRRALYELKPVLSSTWMFMHMVQAGGLGSLGKCGILTYDIALAGGLENRHRNTEDLWTENVHTDSTTKFAHETYVLRQHHGRLRWDPPELSRNSSGDPVWRCTAQSCKSGNKHSLVVLQRWWKHRGFQGSSVQKADSHMELFLGFQSIYRPGESCAAPRAPGGRQAHKAQPSGESPFWRGTYQFDDNLFGSKC